METAEILLKVVAISSKMFDSTLNKYGKVSHIESNPIICFSDMETAYRVAVNADDSDFLLYDSASHADFISRFGKKISASNRAAVKSLFDSESRKAETFHDCSLFLKKAAGDWGPEVLDGVCYGVSQEDILFFIENWDLASGRVIFFNAVTFILPEAL